MSRKRRNRLPKLDYLDRVDEPRRRELKSFLDRLGLQMNDYNLLNRALSHKSYTNERGYSHNEQSEKLEFFGDGVLGLVINEYLFKVFPDFEEGELAKIKSAVVSESSLAEVAEEIGLGKMILLGRSERRSGGDKRPSLLADILEAFIGALYIDQGLPTVRKFILRYLESKVRAVSTQESAGDYKSYLQELVQREHGERPVYTVVKTAGPDHSRTFRVTVSFAGKERASGSGGSKKEAEQAAAERAVMTWKKRSKKSDARGKVASNNAKPLRAVSSPGKKNMRETDAPKKPPPKKKDNARKTPQTSDWESPKTNRLADPVAWAAAELFALPQKIFRRRGRTRR
ncbi:MAG: ribonuclease III [Candidatus Hydrogenedentota bacterium]|nr:MAG: ribonuclease III [Candidatus Hydrogenedentota bacterium]